MVGINRPCSGRSLYIYFSPGRQTELFCKLRRNAGLGCTCIHKGIRTSTCELGLRATRALSMLPGFR